MKIMTIRDIAALSGVGISTVSRVLNGRPDVSEGTRKKVMAVVEQYKYTQNSNAKNLKQQSSNLVSIIVRGRQNSFLYDIAERIIDTGDMLNQMFLLNYIDENDDEFEAARRVFAERKISGIIFVGSNAVDRGGEIEALSLPCVFATVDTSSLGLPMASSVSVDNALGARKAIDFLIKHGHRDIAVFGSGRKENDSIGQRYQGVLQSFGAHKLPLSKLIYVPCSFDMERAYHTIKSFLKKEHASFSAVFAMGDAMAVGAIRALYEAGLRVPEDVSVIGFDGIPLAKFFLPPLTTICQPAEQIARTSVELIMRLLNDPSDCQNVILKSRLLRGGTVKQIDY